MMPGYFISCVLTVFISIFGGLSLPRVSGQAKVENDPKVVIKNFDEGFTPRDFSAVALAFDNIKWFITEAGVASFDGERWLLHDHNPGVPSAGIRGIAFDNFVYGKEAWIASSSGVTLARLPVDAGSDATTYCTDNSPIISNNVLSIATGKGSIRWFGTDKGISVLRDGKWLAASYQRQYPESLFTGFPIKAMAASFDGDSLYVATEGGGVTRFFRDKTDAISGASEYAQWGPIEIPSDKVYSICLIPDGTQWFGTDLGVARHKGFNTLEGWTVFNKESGLVNNFVQAIASDTQGRIWFGTKGGISVFDGTGWTSYTTDNGLISNNIKCILVDMPGVVWFGTDKGVMSFVNGLFTCYR